MSAHEEKHSGLTVFLHFYTRKTYIRKCFLFYQEERYRLHVSEEGLQTAFPVELILEKEEWSWMLNGKQIQEENFCSLRTKAGEEVMVFLSVRKERLIPCERLSLSGKKEIRVGKAFQNEVFYDCLSFVQDQHFRIYQAEEGDILETADGGGKGFPDVYVNGKPVSGQYLMACGDVIELLGMMMIYLKGLLVCFAFYGTLRVAKGREKIPFMEPDKGLETVMPGGEIEPKVMEEKQILTGEVELKLPEPEKIQTEQPLFFTLGPSVTMVIPMLIMALLGSAMLSPGGTGYYRMSVVMTGAAAFLSVFWGLVNHVYQKKVRLKERIRKKEAYREYLNRTETYLEECFYYNQQVLREKYPSKDSFLVSPSGGGQVFWNRSIRQKDFLFIRLGIGDIPFQVRVKIQEGHRGLLPDLLTEEAYQLADKYRILTSVPVGIDLGRQRMAGFAGNGIYPVFLQALLQLAVCHDGRSMKLVYFYHEENEQEKKIADCIRWLPHIFGSGRKIRYLAGNEREAGEILPELVKILEGRQEKGGNPGCIYIFLLAAKELVKGERLYGLLMEAGEGSGIYTLFLEKEREMLPGESECMVIREKDRDEITYYEGDVWQKQKVILEESFFDDTEKFMRLLSGTSCKEKEQEDGLSEKVSFLDLYSCEKVEELNCPGRWRENQTKDRIRVPVGMGIGGRLVCLDVHEKFHGPHGLIAGTTGSGKSELLQTYLLSLAVSFGPEDINFFIIDYKGGGMGNILCRLPHCVGVISNLSGRQIKRALASIKSENKRRQQLFHAAGVNHVADYTGLFREGKVQEPVPHLLLVVDEFAELKKEEPEFMQEIISIAQVGRSLGVHLILSTQKPAGTVDDKIWSNTRFRLCLRVADKQDSMDMLHRPEAAYLTGAGQCYLQVGNNELFELFQAGYGGAEYDGEVGRREGACMISGTGRRFYGSRIKKEKYLTQIEAVIMYVGQVAGKLACNRAKNLWMPELPYRISLENTEQRQGKAEGIELCLGICDDPERQMQYPVYYHPVREGHLCLCGAPAAGKSTFLQTLLWQLSQYPAGQVQFMLAASDNAGVNCFGAMPGCLGSMQKKEEAECFFFHVERLYAKRKEKLAGMNFQQYRRHREDVGAFLFLIIDNYGSFRQMTQDRHEDLIEKLAGEGLNYGIYLIITALNVGVGEIPGKLFEKMKVTMALEMSDRLKYGDILRQYHMNVLPAENIKGRGLCRAEGRVLEFQVPLFSMEEDDYSRIRQVYALSEKMRKRQKAGEIPEKFPCIPEKPAYLPMLEKSTGKEGGEAGIPLGYKEKSGYIEELSINDGFSFLISGADKTGKRNLLCCLMRGLWEKGIKTILFDRKQILSGKADRLAVLAEKEEMLHLILDEAGFLQWYDSRKQSTRHCLCICDLMDFSVMVNARKEEMVKIRREMEQMAEDGWKMPVIALVRPGREMEMAGTPVFEALMKHQYGIHLGGHAANQRMLSFDDLPYAKMNQPESTGVGYLKRGTGSRTDRIRLPLYETEAVEKGEKT